MFKHNAVHGKYRTYDNSTLKDWKTCLISAAEESFLWFTPD